MGRRTREANHAFGLGLDLGLSGGGQPPLVLRSTKRILMVGSSSEAGSGTGDNTGTGTKYMKGARKRGYFARALLRLQARGIPINMESSFGNAENAAGLDPAPVGSNGCDADFDMMCLYGEQYRQGTASPNPGLNMSLSSTVSTIAGHAFTFKSLQTTNIFIDPDIDITEVRAYVRQSSTAAAGSKLWISDAGANEAAPLTFLVGSSDSAVHTLSLTGLASGRHRPKIRGSSSNPDPSYILGWEFWDANRTELRAIMAGARGWGTTEWITNGNGQPRNMMSQLACDIVLDTFGGNEDFSAAGSLDAFIARCTTWYNSVISAGGRPIMLIKPFGPAAGGQVDGGPYTEVDIRNARIALAQSMSIPYFDLSGPAGTYANAVANGELNPDGVHYFKPWHDRVGDAVGDWLYTSGLRGLV